MLGREPIEAKSLTGNELLQRIHFIKSPYENNAYSSQYQSQSLAVFL